MGEQSRPEANDMYVLFYLGLKHDIKNMFQRYPS